MSARWPLLVAVGYGCALAAACSDGANKADVVLWLIPSVGDTMRVPKIEPDSGLDASAQDAAAPDPGAMDGGDDDDGGSGSTPGLAVFDPNEVYVFGSVAEGGCARAVASVTNPDRVVAGFGCEARPDSAVVRPSDGRLLYGDLHEPIRVFNCDGCEYLRPGDAYPAEPDANDESIAVPPCGEQTQGITQFLVARDGSTLHLCERTWYDAQGQPLMGAGSGGLISAGPHRSVLTGTGVLDLESGVVSPFRGLPQGWRGVARSRDEGYWVVIVGAEPDARSELWRVALDGGATKSGVFADLPEGQEPIGLGVLDGVGRLVQRARVATDGGYRNTIVRQSVEGLSDVIYREPDDALLRIGESTLFTGP